MAGWKQWLNRGIKFLGLGILVYILCKIDYPRFVGFFSSIRLSYLGAVLLAAVFVNALKGLRLYCVLKAFGFRYGLNRCVITTFIGNYLGAVTPGRSGELAQAYYLKREAGIPLTGSIPLIVYSRIFDLYLVGMVFILGLFSYEIPIFTREARLVLVLAIALLSSLILIPGVFTALLEFGRKHILPGKFAADPRAVKKKLKPGDILLFLAITGGIYVFLFGRGLVLAAGMGIPIDPLKLIFFIAIVNTIAYLPVTVAGLGTTQAAFVFLFGLEGIGAEAALAYSFAIFFTVYVWGIVLGALCWWRNPIRLVRGGSPPAAARSSQGVSSRLSSGRGIR